MRASTLMSLLFGQVAVTSAWSIPSSHKVKRDDTDATFYAYGTNSSGWPVSYGVNDGLLYISTQSNGSTSTLSPITWAIASITSDNWIANGTLSNGTDAGAMYLVRDSFSAVGVSPMADMSAHNGSPDGFGLFGTQVVYNDDTTLESQFWAQSTSTDGVYALMWNSPGTSQTGSFPVVLKATENTSS